MNLFEIQLFVNNFIGTSTDYTEKDRSLDWYPYFTTLTILIHGSVGRENAFQPLSYEFSKTFHTSCGMSQNLAIT